MIFSVKERLMLQEILPKTGNIITLKLVSDAMDAAGFSEGEVRMLGVTNNEGRITWNPIMEPKCAKEIAIGPELFKVVQAELEKRNEAGELAIDMISLYEKFQKAELKVIDSPPTGPSLGESEDDPGVSE